MNKTITIVTIGSILGALYLFTPNEPTKFNAELVINSAKIQKQTPLPTEKLNSISEAKPKQEVKPLPEAKPIAKTNNKPALPKEIKITEQTLAGLFNTKQVSPKDERDKTRQKLRETQVEFDKLLGSYKERTEYLSQDEFNTAKIRELYTELYQYSKAIAKMQIDLDQKITQKVFGRPPWMAK